MSSAAFTRTDYICARMSQFVKHCGHEPILLDFSGEADEPAGGDAAEARVAKPAPAPKATAVKAGGKPQQKPKPTGAEDGSGKTVKKETLLKIVHSKADDFAGWYTEVRGTTGLNAFLCVLTVTVVYLVLRP